MSDANDRYFNLDHHFDAADNDSPCIAGIRGGGVCGQPRDEHLGKYRRRLPKRRPLIGNFDDWMRLGIERGWCGPPVCATHDSTPMTEAEEIAFDEGEDPCVHFIRPYEDAEMKAAVEANHPPSIWRDHYTLKGGPR